MLSPSAEQSRPSTSFWGAPTYAPQDRDVARFVAAIRDLTKRAPPARKLKLATSAMHAICAFVAADCGPREAIALLDKLRTDVIPAGAP